MRLDLSEIATHLGKRIRYEIDEPPISDPESGLRGVEHVKGDATFANTGNHIVVRGSFKTAVELDCARCLTPIKVDIDLPIEEELPLHGHVVVSGNEDIEVEGELPEDEKEPIFQENILNLTELLRQSILVAVPIKPLCSEACEGLCPHCGKNLNEEECECPPEEAGGAFSALASLLENGEDESKN